MKDYFIFQKEISHLTTSLRYLGHLHRFYFINYTFFTFEYAKRTLNELNGRTSKTGEGDVRRTLSPALEGEKFTIGGVWGRGGEVGEAKHLKEGGPKVSY